MQICTFFNFSLEDKSKAKSVSDNFETRDKYICPKCHKRMKFHFIIERGRRAPSKRILRT